MLDSHPGIDFKRHIEIELAVQRMRADGSPPTSLEPFYADLETNLSFQRSGYTVDRTLDWNALLQSFVDQSLEESTASIALTTIHDNFPRAASVWPNARWLYLLRDGRDVATSRMEHGWEGNYWCATAPWLDAERQLAELRKRVPASQIMEVRFEDLVANSVDVLTNICHFLGLEYDEAIFDYLDRTEFRPPDASLAHRWRMKMKREELQLAEARIGEKLRERGYPMSDFPPRTVSPREARRYERENRWQKRRARIAMVGWRCFLVDLVTRKLGLTRWNTRNRLEMEVRERLKKGIPIPGVDEDVTEPTPEKTQ